MVLINKIYSQDRGNHRPPLYIAHLFAFQPFFISLQCCFIRIRNYLKKIVFSIYIIVLIPLH